MPISSYLTEIIDYGGELCTRAEAIADMQRMGLPQGCIDRWLQGYELAQRIGERRASVEPTESQTSVLR